MFLGKGGQNGWTATKGGKGVKNLKKNVDVIYEQHLNIYVLCTSVSLTTEFNFAFAINLQNEAELSLMTLSKIAKLFSKLIMIFFFN